MRFNELVQILEKNGWKLCRTAKSSARFYEKNGQKLNVHYHGNHEVPNGTAQMILKQAGIKPSK